MSAVDPASSFRWIHVESPALSKAMRKGTEMKYGALLLTCVLTMAGLARAAVTIDDFDDYMTPVVSPAVALSWGGGWKINADRWVAQPATHPGQATYLETG